MKTLFVLRHAKSSWRDMSLADHERPLKKRGRKAAPKMGHWARVNNVWPDAVISSTAVRAHQTALAFVQAGKFDLEIELEPKFYDASPKEILRLLRPRSEHAVLVVGHNPSMEDLVEMLTGEELRFVTAALAWIELPIETWSELNTSTRGHLREFWIPRSLD